ncbi:MAG: hypothetical protein MUP41_12015 [Desulfobacterales bacterium]|nr:hypothetical protein [Desulfobacterales bacterium]
MDGERLLVGWKEIMAAFNVRSLKTMKKKVKKYALPIVTVARKPTIYLHEVKEWRESRRRQAKEGIERSTRFQ